MNTFKRLIYVLFSFSVFQSNSGFVFVQNLHATLAFWTFSIYQSLYKSFGIIHHICFLRRRDHFDFGPQAKRAISKDVRLLKKVTICLLYKKSMLQNKACSNCLPLLLSSNWSKLLFTAVDTRRDKLERRGGLQSFSALELHLESHAKSLWLIFHIVPGALFKN